MIRRTVLWLVMLALCVPVTGAMAEEGHPMEHSGIQAERADALPAAEWQKTAVFPDWKGYTDDTLAMDSMLSYLGYHGQGCLWLEVDGKTESFRLYVNEVRVDTTGVSEGVWRVDTAAVARDGMNTIQLSNIRPSDARVTVHVPYPTILDGTLEEAGIRPEAVQLISDIIASDIEYGFTSAQLAVVRSGRLVYNRAWGRVNSYHQDGTPDTDSPLVTTDTLYDLASVTKMFSTNYAIQKLVTDGRLDINAHLVDILGQGFADDVIDLQYVNGANPDIETMRAWKAALTVRDLLCHQGGFPADVHYFRPYFDLAALSGSQTVKNVLFTGNDGSGETRENTLEALFKTPLYYEPGTRTVYSDLDYMLLGFVVERITGQRLDDYVSETFYRPMGLTHVTYNPLEHGFSKEDCAATELNGNTRDRHIDFEGVRTATLQGEVHDEKAAACMGGVSGHAGLFGSAADMARLASVMLTGGYGDRRFFSGVTMDRFTAPKSFDYGQWGLGWWREGDDQRPWYFGTQSASDTIGHQGWTGTLVMVDPSRQLVVAYLTNKINSPITSDDNLNRFDGNWYTASTLGFVPQILSIGMDSDADITGQLADLAADMAQTCRRLLPAGVSPDDDHPSARNLRSKQALAERYQQSDPD